MSQVARLVLELKKVGGGTYATSKISKATKHYTEHIGPFEDLIIKQVELIDPTVIICLGRENGKCISELLKNVKESTGVVSLKRLLNHSILENWSSKLIKKSLETYFFISRTKLYFLKNNMKTCQHLISSVRRKCKEL